MSNTALAVVEKGGAAVSMPTVNEWQIMVQQAEMLVSTGFLPSSIKTSQQAVAIMLQGRELGIPTMAALGTINVINGKPTISPQLMMALIERSGQLENLEINDAQDPVICTMKRRGRSPYTSKFGTKEATDLGLIGKDNYKKQAQTMFKWRAVAAAARTVFPDVVLGLYTPDEMGAETDAETGEIIESAQGAQIHSLPTKGQLVNNARQIVESQPENKLSAPINAASLSIQEKSWRAEIEYLSKKIGRSTDGAKTLATFDARQDLRETCLTKIQKAAIKYAIASDDWGYTEDGTTEFLSSHNIVSIEAASKESLAACVAELRELGNL